MALGALGQGALEDGGRDARTHLVLVARECEEGSARPQHVSRRCVRVALRRIQEEVADPGAGDVLLLRRHICEDDPPGEFFTGPRLRGPLQVRLAEFREPKQPKIGIWYALEDTEPGAEGSWINLDLGVSRVIRRE